MTQAVWPVRGLNAGRSPRPLAPDEVHVTLNAEPTDLPKLSEPGCHVLTIGNA